jgi:putative nucleotidyltransferase with HDIG domain
MQKTMLDSALRNAEQKTVTWFITLFYLISVVYDLFYYYILPKSSSFGPVGLPSVFNYWIYIIMFALIPLAIYFNKSQKLYLIKYVYAITYLLLTTINDFTIYYGSDLKFHSGNITELFVILFSPIFVNSRFYWVVSLGTICKYIFLAATLKSSDILLGIIIVIILSLISFMFLNRFKGYVAAVKNSYDQQLQGIVKGVIATLELKDPYTRGHSERVAGYAQILAQETGMFSNEDLKSYYYACLLHDIGKIQIPDQILMKPTSLSKGEFDIIQTHPAVGAEAIKDVEGLTSYIDVIRSHHERWDGMGYPDKLHGAEIPILARITSIADAFDAMTSSRSYRAAMPLEVAYSRILEGKGSQFDPNFVEVFQSVFPKWEEFHKNQWDKANEINI